MQLPELSKIVDLLKQGEIIAYPTEGVFGLGCDPLDAAAVHRLLQLKQRPVDRGLIIIAANWEQLNPWISPLFPASRLNQIKQSTTEVITWVVPASDTVPDWIRGIHATVAVRVSQHPIANSICEAFGTPIVSTSANISTMDPCVTYAETQTVFGKSVKLIVNAPVGTLKKASIICDALSGRVLRA